MEVKSDDGGKKEALAQLAIWLAAGLEKIRQLGEQVKGEGKDPADWLLPNIGLTIIGHDWYIYLAYKAGNEVVRTFFASRDSLVDNVLLTLVSLARGWSDQRYCY